MPKIVDVDQYRQELLNKCFDLFANQGYASVTTRQIAKELGVSTGTLYHYFPNKQALFEQLVEQISLQDVGILSRIDQNLSIAQKIEALGLILVDHQEYIIKQAAIWDNFYQQQADHDINSNSIFRQADLLYQQAIADLLDIEDLELARFIWTLVDGIAIANIGSTDSSSNSSFAIQIQLLTQMLIAYFEKHQAN
jgi:AcrR family transcriptional regulator